MGLDLVQTQFDFAVGQPRRRDGAQLHVPFPALPSPAVSLSRQEYDDNVSYSGGVLQAKSVLFQTYASHCDCNASCSEVGTAPVDFFADNSARPMAAEPHVTAPIRRREDRTAAFSAELNLHERAAA